MDKTVNQYLFMDVRNLLVFIIMNAMLLTAACREKTSETSSGKRVQISLSSDSSAVQLCHVRPDVLEYLKSDSLSLKEWQSFFSVFPTPKDPEMRDFQPSLPGSYSVRDTTIVFIPEEPFAKDSSYFARCFSRQIMDEPSDLLMGKKLSAESEFVEFDFKR